MHHDTVQHRPPFPLQPHVLVLGRCLQLCDQQVAADAAQFRLRQLRGDGEMSLRCRARCTPILLLHVAGDAFPLQIAAYCVSALASGTMFRLWRRMGREKRRRVWLLYGWFSGLMLCGSCFGAVAWGAGMQVFVFNFLSPSSLAQSDVFHVQFTRGDAVFSITYAIEVFCMSVAKLMVLDRMSSFAVPKAEGMSRRWVVGRRIVMAAVVAGNVVGLGGSITAAVYFERTAEFYSAAVAAYAANSTADGNNFTSLAAQQQQLAVSTQTVQLMCEVAVLLLIVVTFAVVGFACARRISSALTDMTDASHPVAAAGKQLRRQIVGTTAFVFVTFLLRAVYSTMYALASGLQNVAAGCPSNNPCDASCYNVYTLMGLWFFFTPEFQLAVILISSPLALLIALWGMTSQRTVQQMQSNRRHVGLTGSMLLGNSGISVPGSERRT